MNLDALEKMSTDALCSIRDKTIEVLRERSIGAMRVGAIGWLIDGGGTKRHMRINRINAKSISATEVDPITLKALPTRWKVGHNSLTILNTGPKPTRAAPVELKPKSTLGDDAW